MNLVILKGNVGQDPKITTFQNGGKSASFSLATTERGFTTKDGRQIPPQTDWHNVVVRASGLAGVVEKYVKKGTPLLIQGRLAYRTYEDNAGQTRYVTEVLADDIEMLSSGEKKQAGRDYQPLGSDFPEQ